MKATRLLCHWLFLLGLSLLTACGGGGSASGSGGTSFPAASSTEGTWQGPYATVYNSRLVVLNNGETYGVYESGGTLAGALYGQLSGDGSTAKGALKDFSLNSLSVTDANITGTVTAQKYMPLNRGTQRLDLSYATNMDTPVSVASLAGVYSGRGGNSFGPAEAMNVSISSNGTINLPEPVCSSTGQISPSGNNIFALSLTITGNNCGRRGNTLNGVLYQDPNNKRLYLLALNSARSDAALFFGYRN